MRFPVEVTDVRDNPSDWEPPPIGANAEVRRTIVQVIPELPGVSGKNRVTCRVVIICLRLSVPREAKFAIQRRPQPAP